MARTSVDRVLKIIDIDDADVTEGRDPQVFIDYASILVDDHCTGVNGPTIPYSDAKLELIERWLSAHAWTNFDPRTVEEETGDAQGKFEGKFGLFLNSSRYGQHAIFLDDNGGLDRRNKAAMREPTIAEGTSPQIVWMGTPKEDQEDA